MLSDVDELIGSLEALIAKKRAMKQAAMQELLTGRTQLPAERVAEPGVRWETDTETDLRGVAALAVDRAIRKVRMADWRGHPIKEKRIGRAIRDALGAFKAYTHTIFEIVKANSEY